MLQELLSVVVLGILGLACSESSLHLVGFPTIGAFSDQSPIKPAPLDWLVYQDAVFHSIHDPDLLQ
jgi:hypothetical protein